MPQDLAFLKLFASPWASRKGQIMPKRGNGQGSLQQRGHRWVAALSLGKDADGKLRRLVRTFDHQEKAQAWLDQHTRSRGQEDSVPLEVCHPDVLTFGSFLGEWLIIKRPHVREQTWRDYERVVRLHLLPSGLASLTLGGLRPLHIERFLLTLLAANRSPTLVFLILRVVKLALGQAVDWGLLAFNSASRVKAPKRRRQEMQVWTPQQVQTFLTCCEEHQPRLYALFHLALATGMRRGELLGLHWRDVDLERGELLVRVSVVQCGAKAVLSEPKTPASRRRLLLAPETVAVLRQHRERQQAGKGRWKARSEQEEDLVFPSSVGRFQLPWTLVRLFHKLVTLAGVPHIRFHDLRHTAASLLVRRGVPIKAVAERLGHTDASLTMRVYTHVYEEQRREAALSLQMLLSDTDS